MTRFLSIGLMGVLGVFARYFVGLWVHRYLPTQFPYGTLFINVLGAFLIGIVYALGIERSFIPYDLRIGITVGFLGGFTTFSSYCLESFRLFEESEVLAAWTYLVGSPALGLGASFLGIILTRMVLR